MSALYCSDIIITPTLIVNALPLVCQGRLEEELSFQKTIGSDTAVQLQVEESGLDSIQFPDPYRS